MFFKNRDEFDKEDLGSIINACIQKNEKAEKKLIGMFLSYGKSIALRYSGNNQEAEEIVYDAFFKVFQNLSRYDTAKPFKTWLRIILINTALDHYRRKHKHESHLDIDEMQVVDFNDDIISKISADEIMALIRTMPASYRTVFTLYAIDGYTHKEIAAFMGIQEGTSKSNLRDARNKLKELIRIHYPHLYLAYTANKLRTNEN